MFVLRQILVQSNEWKEALYANFVYFKKVLDNLSLLNS